jgi:DNA-binding NarL/FixJ family response regulator
MMDTLLNYVSALVSPIKVCVIDSEEEVGYQIEDALSVYNCNVRLVYDPVFGCKCLQTGRKCSPDLVFIADNVPNCLEVIRHLEQEQPETSVVVLTRTPGSPIVAEIMKHGVYTFLTKNGSFTANSVKCIFQQLNIRLHASDPAGPESGVKTEAQPS